MATTTPRKSPQSALLTTARALLAQPIRFEELLQKLAPKDRANAERRLEAFLLADQGARANLWRRLASAMMTLAPVVKIIGKQTIQFFIPDGKYRMQVFALEDLQDGNMTIYCPDVLAECVDAGLLDLNGGAADDETATYATGNSKEPLLVELLDKNTVNPAPHFKDLVGWNRKALRITLSPAASPAQIETAEYVCAIAASHFVSRPAPVPTPHPARA